MIAAIVLALQLTFGIANPNAAQINAAGPVLYGASYQPIAGGGNLSAGPYIDPSELGVYKAAHPTN